jgi:glycolate oxidase FAD binding subunit
MVDIEGLLASGQQIRTRAADPGHDAIDGVLPGVIVQPASREGVAATLAWASSAQLSVVLRGGGSKLQWGARPARLDVVLDTAGLNRIIDHESGDLTVTVEAGVRLADLNRQLSLQGQWLALDPPFPAATVGGLLATNDSGPCRHRFGTPRDLVIGIELATADGQLGKAGGRVVKNVAGYDLSKIISGSFGALAAVTSATFKLSPIAAAVSSLVVETLDIDTAAALAEGVMGSQLEPVAFDIDARFAAGQAGSISTLLRFASFPAVVEAETTTASARVAAIHHTSRVVSGDEERRLWEVHAARLWHQRGLIVRASWLPANLRPMLLAMRSLSSQGRVEVTGRVGVGSGTFLLDVPESDQREIVDRMRTLDVFGNVVVMRGPASLRSQDWVWGTARMTSLAVAIKHELDPNGILGASRGPL